MKLHKLGDTSLLISSIGLGGMSLIPTQKEENQQIISKARDAGINYFDTADLYDKGENEKLLGKLLKPYRKEVILATKVGNKWRDDGSGWDWKASKTYILEAVESSLTRLQTDYIDLYQLHGGTIEDPIEDIIDAFEILKVQGKIRAYGISSIRPNVIKTYLEKSQLSSIMMQYSLLDRRPEEYFDLISTHGVSVIARGTLSQGLLLDKPAKEYLSYSEEEVIEFKKKIHDLAKQLHVSPQTLSTAYTLAHRPVGSAIIGIRTAAQMEDLAITINQLAKLNANDLLPLEHGLKTIQYSDHR